MTEHAGLAQADGCGCGGEHAVEQPVAAEGCAEGCGCGHGAGLEMHPLEEAALRGFLSGLHAANLDQAALAEYLADLASEAGSEFARPAQLLQGVLGQLSELGALSAQPAQDVLVALTGPADEEE